MLQRGALGSTPERRLTQIENWPRSENIGGEIGPLRHVADRDHLQHSQLPNSPSEGSITSPQERRRKRKRGDRYPLRTSTAVIPQRPGSVWALYEKRFETNLDGEVTIVEKKDGTPGGVLAVRTVSKENQDRKLRLLNQFQDPSLFVRVVEVFFSENMMHIVREDMDLTLMHILAAPVFPQETHIAAIAGKVTRGLGFLHQHHLVHGNLTLSTVLLNHSGEVKLANIEGCQRESDSTQKCLHDLQNLGQVVMYLVTKTDQDDRRPEVNRYSPKVLDFVSQTTSTTASDLCQHPMLQISWSTKNLIWLVRFTLKVARHKWALPIQESEISLDIVIVIATIAAITMRNVKKLKMCIHPENRKYPAVWWRGLALT